MVATNPEALWIDAFENRNEEYLTFLQVGRKNAVAGVLLAGDPKTATRPTPSQGGRHLLSTCMCVHPLKADLGQAQGLVSF